MTEGKTESDSAPARLAKGKELEGRFVIKAFLGAGSFGEVYHASQLMFGRPIRDVALKLFKSNVVSAENCLEVFNDALTLFGLHEELEDDKHHIADSLIRIYDMGFVEGRAFISMPLVPGRRTLNHIVRKWRDVGLAVESSLNYMRQLLVPLAWMHTLDPPAVHADLKPDNVLMRPNQQLVITDFGLATRMPLASVGGAIIYLPPETLLTHEAKVQADVYALGLIWYQLLTGRHPFEHVGLDALGSNDKRAYMQAQTEARNWPVRPAEPGDDAHAKRIAPPSEFSEDLRQHPQVEAMILKCLAPKLSDRYFNARRLLDDVEAYLKGSGPQPDSTLTLSRPESPDPAPSLGQRTPQQLLDDAMVVLNSNDAKRAEGLVLKAITLGGRTLCALLALAQVKRGRMLVDESNKDNLFDDALDLCDEAKKLDANDPQPYAVMADLYDAMAMTSLATKMREQERSLRAGQVSRRR